MVLNQHKILTIFNGNFSFQLCTIHFLKQNHVPFAFLYVLFENKQTVNQQKKFKDFFLQINI